MLYLKTKKALTFPLKPFVLEAGIEPALQRNWILNPARLPVPPLELTCFTEEFVKLDCKTIKYFDCCPKNINIYPLPTRINF